MPDAKRPRMSQPSDQPGPSATSSEKSFQFLWMTDGELLLPMGKSRRTKSKRYLHKNSETNLAPSRVIPSAVQTSSFERYRQLVETSSDASSIPHARPSSNFSFADFASAMASADNAAVASEKETWDLLQILFDAQDSSQGAEDESVTRKTLLSQYWKSIVTPTALSHAERAENAEEKAFAQLSANDVSGATETLLAGGNPKLAMMMAQIEIADNEFKATIRDQIDHWRDTNVLSEIPHRIRALYELLAGNACTADGKMGAGPENKAENFNISARLGLNWRQSFGLRLWYASLSDEPIEAAISIYKHQLDTYQEQVRPRPSFHADGWKDPDPDRRTDVLWSLLKLYDKLHSGNGRLSVRELADLLAPENVAGNPLSAQLSFLLSQTLRARGLIAVGTSDIMADEVTHLFDGITSTFLAQLSSSPNDLVSAIFVALHLTHPATRYSAITTLLTTHASALGSNSDAPTWAALTQLQIPNAWLWQAKATHARTVLRDEKARCLFLLRAGDVIDACDVLRSIVAPGAVVAETLLPTTNTSDSGTSDVPSDLKSILQEFENNDEAAALAEWTSYLGGAVYARYVQLIERTERHRRSGRAHYNAAESRELQGLIQELQQKLESVGEGVGLKERVAAWEMKRIVGEVGEELRRQEDGMVIDTEKDVERDGEEQGGVMREVEKRAEQYYHKVGWA
ncbi:MAG: hypothetical protein Q9162_004180 [Coniocarpon cinnabarinum]